MWAHILRDQLEVSPQEFWACVLDGQHPDRGTPEPPENTLPSALVFQFIRGVGLSADEVSKMSKEEAVSRMQEFWMNKI